MSRFRDRAEAGRALAEILRDEYAGRDDVVVLALPRGGVPVAREVAHALGAQLDVFVVRKLGVPGHEELAMGAIASGGVIVLDEATVAALGIDDDEIAEAAATEACELGRREEAYRRERALTPLAGTTVIVVDDGLATGSTMRAAVVALRRHDPAQIVVAVPVAAPRSCADLEGVADRVVCPATPQPFHAVGLWYDDFSQLTDDEVSELLAGAEARR